MYLTFYERLTVDQGLHYFGISLEITKCFPDEHTVELGIRNHCLQTRDICILLFLLETVDLEELTHLTISFTLSSMISHENNSGWDRYLFLPHLFPSPQQEFKTAAKASILSLFSHHKVIWCDFSKCNLELPEKVEWDSHWLLSFVTGTLMG